MNEDISAERADSENAVPEPSASDIAAQTAANPDSSIPPRYPVDSVLLIDADNDPHVPSDVRPTRHTLVRVFLRPGAKMPRTLEKKLGHLPHCATVVSPVGGANAADFVMSLHAGMLHAILPHHVPFLMVTNDATIQAMAAELQRLGRVATVWTSHTDAAALYVDEPETVEAEEPKRSRSRGGRSRSRGGRAPSRRGGRGRSRSGREKDSAQAPAPSAPPPPAAPVSDEPRKPGGKPLSEVAWTYAARLQRIKDVPSRLKTLLNDIKNRAGSQGFAPEEILEELKRHHGVKVDAQGRVQVARVKPAGEEPAAEAPEVSPS